MPTKLTTNDFITKANKVHNNFYDYSKTIYSNAHTKVTITCPVHGDFTQKACNHINASQGCPKCANNERATVDEFILKANLVHNNFYTYTKTMYKNSHTPVIITCPDHGDFSQKPYVHLQNHRCPKCGTAITKTKLSERATNWSYSGWKTNGELSEHFQGFTLYVVECWNDTERFIKIGKTFTDLHRRFVKGSLPYKWKLITQHIGSAEDISNLENTLHNTFKDHKYTPTIIFNGYQECYTLTVKDLYGINPTTTTNS